MFAHIDLIKFLCLSMSYFISTIIFHHTVLCRMYHKIPIVYRQRTLCDCFIMFLTRYIFVLLIGIRREDFDSFSSKILSIIPFVSRINARLNNPWTPSKVTGTRDDHFRNNLKRHLGMTSNNIPCMLTQQVGNGEQVCGAHILPCKTAEFIYVDLSMTVEPIDVEHPDLPRVDDLNSPRNGLFLAKNVEREFDLLRLSFVPKDVLHPNQFKMVIWSDKSRNVPIWEGHAHKIGQYEGCTLILNGHDPFRRALSFQAYQAHGHARGPPEECHQEFGTPPSNFITMRSQLEANYETSYREEVLSEDEDE
jgi:hypothetical protein